MVGEPKKDEKPKDVNASKREIKTNENAEIEAKEAEKEDVESNESNESSESNESANDEETETEIVTEVVTEIVEEEGTTIVYEDEEDTTTESPNN